MIQWGRGMFPRKKERTTQMDEKREVVEGQLQHFSETAQEYKQALIRRCGNVKAVAGVVWDGNAAEIGASTLSVPGITAEEWANLVRAFLLLPFMDGTLTREDVQSILQSALAMLLRDRAALEDAGGKEDSDEQQ